MEEYFYFSVVIRNINRLNFWLKPHFDIFTGFRLIAKTVFVVGTRYVLRWNAILSKCYFILISIYKVCQENSDV